MRHASLQILLAICCLLVGQVIPAYGQGSIVGTVTDAADGEPLPGVNIIVQGLNIGAATGPDGNYRVEGVPAGSHTVEARFIGYQTASQQISLIDGEEVAVDFALSEETFGLDEVVVTGMAGEARRREIGTAMTQVDTDDLDIVPVDNIETLLRGVDTGIQSLAVTGQVGGGGTIRLRGVTSVSQGNEPLIFVEGVRLSTSRVPPANLEDGRGPRITSNPLNFINPEDIQDIEIIKGAAATTLYGTEASGGVIQIFLRDGARGRPSGSFSVTTGSNFWPQLSDVITSHPTELDLNTVKRRGLKQRYAGSVRGGSDNLTYFISGSFSDEQGIVDTQYSEGWSVTGNFELEILEGLTASWINTYRRQESQFVGDSNNRHGYILNVMRLDKGYNPGSRENDWVLEQELTADVDNFISGVSLDHTLGDPLDGLNNQLRLGYHQIESLNQGLLPFGYLLNPNGTIGTTRWQNRVLSAEYIGNWNQPVSDQFHSAFSWGGQVFDESTVNVVAGGIDFAGPGNQTVSSAARTFGQENRIREVNTGFFIQEKLGWRERLYAIAGLRADGSSTFGEDYGFEFYPKLSLSYVISDEGFWPAGNWWNSLRLRSAVGVAGKAPGAFDAVRTYSPISGLEGQAGVTPNNLGNPNLGPERTREIEVGFDSEMFSSRFNLEVTYFNATTYDALFPVIPTPTEGFSGTQLRNVGTLASQGLEFSADFTPLQSEAFQWDLGFDLTKTDDEVTDTGGAPPLGVGYEQQIRDGFSPPSFFGRKVTNPNELADPVFEEDAFLGQTFPDLTMLFRTSVDIGQAFSFSATGELSRGGHMVNATAYLNTVRGYWPATQPYQEKMAAEGVEALTAAERAKVVSGFRGYDQFIEAADFFKLRNVTMTYRLPPSVLPLGTRATLSLSGTNLLRITDYTGLDPEVIEGGSSGTENFRRVEYYTLPPYRSIQVKLNVNV